MNYVWVIPITAGLFIELFFRFIRFRDRGSLNGPIAKYRPYNNYISVTEYVSGGKKRWWKYVVFRALPPFIVLILTVAIYQKYFNWLAVSIPVLLSALISLLPRDVYQLFKRNVPTSEKLVHITNLLVVAVVAELVILCSKLLNLRVLAPNISGVIDNLWSALFVSVLIVFYLDATNQTRNTFDNDKKNQHDNYVVEAYNKIKQKYEETILTSCKKTDCSVPLLYSILIYENMNRPTFARKLENSIVRLTHLELTVGIAQIKSLTPLTDEKSIEIASAKLKKTRRLVQECFEHFTNDYSSLESMLQTYNGSSTYSEPIIQILLIMKSYAQQEFLN
jgi:hypothetical protein